MSRLRPLSKRKVLKILRDNGFKLVLRGKHNTYKRKFVDEDGNERVLTTWIHHTHKEIRPDILKYIIDQTEKPREEFC